MSDVMFSHQRQCPLGAGHMGQQNWLAFPTWAMVLCELRSARVIELGTGSGGFSLMLAKLCQAIWTSFTTYDHGLSDELKGKLNSFGAVAESADIFDPQFQSDLRRDIAAPGMTILLCDNGNKIREMHDFTSALKSGDIIAAHDYSPTKESRQQVWRSSEITLGDVADLLPTCPQWRPEWFDQTGWLTLRKT